MDPLIKIWMYENWLEDYKDKSELAKNHAYLLGSFWDPKAVQEMMGTSGNVMVSSDKEFEQSTEMVLRDRDKTPITVKKKRRRRIKGLKLNGN
jgi:hypothetical protein